MARIKLIGYRCERCSHEWVPRESDQEPRVCPRECRQNNLVQITIALI